MSEKDRASPEAVAKLLEQPQSYGNGYECCKQMVALARALREARDENEKLQADLAKYRLQDARDFDAELA